MDMKRYSQPKAGTSDKQTNYDRAKQNEPKDVKIYGMLQYLQKWYKGDLKNEWQ